MRAVTLHAARTPLRLEEHAAMPRPGGREVLLRVHACGVCRTDLHIVDGELTGPKLPLVPGHEIVGTVAAVQRGLAALHHGTGIRQIAFDALKLRAWVRERLRKPSR